LPQTGLAQVLRQLPPQRHPDLLVGTDTCDDAGVFRISDDLALVQTVDFFPPLVNDPFRYGRIAAANALSDVYAMGAVPLTAMNIVGFPVKRMEIGVLTEILRGGLDKLKEARTALVGGHSVEDAELKYGLSVTGIVHPDKVLTSLGARAGDRLVLTKPLGTGIVCTAIKAEMAGPEVEAKRLELLRGAVPRVSRVVYLGSKEDKEWRDPYRKSVRMAARVQGVTLLLAEFTPHQFTDAFTLISRARAGALFVGNSTPAFADRGLIVDFATRTRLPSTFGFREAVELGGLMSYGASFTDNLRRAAGYVDKILKGAKPADLPIERPTKFELVINLKTAKALGLRIPQSLPSRADEVIQ